MHEGVGEVVEHVYERARAAESLRLLVEAVAEFPRFAVGTRCVAFLARARFAFVVVTTSAAVEVVTGVVGVSIVRCGSGWGFGANRGRRPGGVVVRERQRWSRLSFTLRISRGRSFLLSFLCWFWGGQRWILIGRLDA